MHKLFWLDDLLPFKKKIYRYHNKIERMFCCIKDAGRIATRYDKLASSFLSSVCLMAAV
jgi:transposase